MLQRVWNRAVFGNVALRVAVELQRAFVVGLLQRVRNRAVLGNFALLRAILLEGTLVEGLLQGVRDETDVTALAARCARFTRRPGLTRRPLRTRTGGFRARNAVAFRPRTTFTFRTRHTIDVLPWATIGLVTPSFAATPVAAAAASALTFALTRRVLRLLRMRRTRWRCTLTWACRRGFGAWPAGQATQVAKVVFVEIDPDTALQPAWQHHAAVANADEPADGMTHGLEQTPHLAVASFSDDAAVPVVDAFPATVFDALEGAALAIDVHTVQQPGLGIGVEHAQRAHRVLALDAESRVHELVGQLARSCEQQQAFGVDVEPAHALPLALLQARQTAEDSGALLRIVMRDDLASGLVISQHTRRRRRDAVANRFAVQLDAVAEADALADMRRLAVHRETAFRDHVLEIAA